MDYKERIAAELKNCLTGTNLPLGNKKTGKVRDTYDLGDALILITTDRQSAFDRILASIPFKGQVLNQVSAWWFERTKHILPNHVIGIPDPNVTVGKKCAVFPVEFVVRGYITGSTDTSAWMNYQKGVRNFCGNLLPEGLKKNQKFEMPIVTPTTKFEAHDRILSPAEIIGEGMMSAEDWNFCMAKALALFKFGQETARQHGLILVDTKYELGKDKTGVITLLDEIHTPDSSRYWLSGNYDERFAGGLEPEYIDKEFLRLWFKEHCDPYKDKDLPPAPEDLAIELSRRYIQLYEMITGQLFQFPEPGKPITDRIKTNLQTYLASRATTPASPASAGSATPPSKGGGSAFVRRPQQPLSPPYEGGDAEPSEAGVVVAAGVTAVLILGSSKDEDHAKKITDAMDQFHISHEQYVASAHRQAREALAILDKYRDQKVIYITMAGRSNALSGFVAGNSNKVTIACPPFSDKTDMLVNIHSTIQMPTGVPVMTILEPANVALAVKRIIELC